MSVDVQLRIAEDEASAELDRTARNVNPHTIATKVAVPCAKHWRNSLAAMPKNRRGWPSTGFWEDAARRVIGVADGGTVRLSSDKLGLRQRYHGGTITARNHKYLTIPICAEAYGTKVADWGIKNLVLVINKSTGSRWFALWLPGASKLPVAKVVAPGTGYANRAEKSTRAANRFRTSNAGQKKPDVIIFSGGGHATARVAKQANLKFLFLLVEEVDQAANPGVVPPDLGDVAFEAVMEATR